MSRPVNFSAGPSMIPLEVLETLRDEMVNFHDTGLSLVEVSHRGPAYDEIHQQAISLIKKLMSVPDGYSVLLVGGGATMQFSMLPMNLMTQSGVCDYVISGAWAKKAWAEGKKVGDARVIWDGKDSAYSTLPDPGTITASEGSAYVHITTNETIGGIQWKEFPVTGDVPLVADMSSDILSRPVPVERFGVIYAGAQKNLGPAGVTVVIIRDDLLERSSDDLGAYLDYRTHAKASSLYNTPPVFAIWAMKLVLEWLENKGGAQGIASRNQAQADLLYGAIDTSGGFYRSPVDRGVASPMNVVWRLPSEDLESLFIKEATAAGLTGLKGHRSVGGCRASLYNAMTIEGVQRLVDFMGDFSRKNG